MIISLILAGFWLPWGKLGRQGKSTYKHMHSKNSQNAFTSRILYKPHNRSVRLQSLFIMLSLWKSSVLKPVLLDPMAFQMFQGQHCCWWHILFLNCQGCRRIIVCLKSRESGVPSLPASTPYCLQLDSLLEVCNPKCIISLSSSPQPQIVF